MLGMAISTAPSRLMNSSSIQVIFLGNFWEHFPQVVGGCHIAVDELVKAFFQDSMFSAVRERRKL